jgi:hypothetical protein
MENVNLTEAELKFVNEIQVEMEFFERYKEFMRQVKKIYLEKGPKSAKYFIMGEKDTLLTIATDEMFHALMTKL